MRPILSAGKTIWRYLSPYYFLLLLVAYWLLLPVLPSEIVKAVVVVATLSLTVVSGFSFKKELSRRERPQTKWMLLGSAITVFGSLLLLTGVVFAFSPVFIYIGLGGALAGMSLHTVFLLQRSQQSIEKAQATIALQKQAK